MEAKDGELLALVHNYAPTVEYVQACAGALDKHKHCPGSNNSIG